MAGGPIRRAHMVGQSGVGAMTVLVNGISVVTSPIDQWFREATEIDEFRLNDWRLERRLNVDHFRLPPDYRRPKSTVRNPKIEIPAYRFPQWFECSICHRLSRDKIYHRTGSPPCRYPHEGDTGKGKLAQVQLVSCCERGHLAEFPWWYWVHGQGESVCNGPLKLVSTTGIGVTAFRVTCEGCGRSELLDRALDVNAITNRFPQLTCRGNRVWQGDADYQEPCGLPLTALVRTASNVYFSIVQSALHLPVTDNRPIEKCIEALNSPPLDLLVTLGADENAIKANAGPILVEFTVDQVREALRILRNPNEAIVASLADDDTDDEIVFRLREHRELLRAQETEFLAVRPQEVGTYSNELSQRFSAINLIPRLRETRVQVGFQRIQQSAASNRDLQNMMWQAMPQNPKERWLPAFRVYGEGIFFQLDETRVREWEQRPAVLNRILQMSEDIDISSNATGLNLTRSHPILARLMLVHTLSHALLREFVVSCGYTMAALRERLFISAVPTSSMASVLIYTASGDSSGSLGGLVRLGEVDHLPLIIERALQRARWCAADPVCMEAIPESVTSTRELGNLAACHNCMFIPETSCEEFNGLLDRALLVGTDEEPALGFFETDI